MAKKKDVLVSVESIVADVLDHRERTFDVVAHELAEAQGQYDDVEKESKLVAKDYSRRLTVLSSQTSELAAEYRKLERREEFDYDEGVVRVFNGRTGELIETRPLADVELQKPLDLPADHCSAAR